MTISLSHQLSLFTGPIPKPSLNMNNLNIQIYKHAAQVYKQRDSARGWDIVSIHFIALSLFKPILTITIKQRTWCLWQLCHDMYIKICIRIHNKLNTTKVTGSSKFNRKVKSLIYLYILLCLSTAMFMVSYEGCHTAQTSFYLSNILCALSLSKTRTIVVPLWKHVFQSFAGHFHRVRIGALLCMQ